MLVLRLATCHSLWSFLVWFEGERFFSVHNLFKGKSSPISFTLRCTFCFEELMYVWSTFVLNVYILIWSVWYNVQRPSKFLCSLQRLAVFFHSFPLQRPLHGEQCTMNRLKIKDCLFGTLHVTILRLLDSTRNEDDS